MKFMPLIFVFSLMFVTACQESSKKKSSSSSSSNYCDGTNYYTNPSCPGYSGGTTSGTTTGGTTGTNCYATQYNYYCVSGCPGYSASNSMCGSTSGTTGSTTGSTTNPYPNYPSADLGGWTGKYPGGVPTGSCTEATSPSGITYTPYDTRKATMTVVGKTFYNPASGVTYMTTSSILQSVSTAKNLFATDSVLKVRFKVRQQPEATNASPYCTGRTSASSIAGYTKLQFTVQLVGLNESGNAINASYPDFVGSYEIGVNSCTPAVDLSSYASQYPGGFYLIVGSAKGNQAYFPNDYATNGFKNVTGFSDIRSSDCWSLDIEVAADGTKTF